VGRKGAGPIFLSWARSRKKLGEANIKQEKKQRKKTSKKPGRENRKCRSGNYKTGKRSKHRSTAANFAMLWVENEKGEKEHQKNPLGLDVRVK